MSTRNIDTLRTLTFHFALREDGDGTVPLGAMNECLQQFCLANQAMAEYHRRQVDTGVLDNPDDAAAVYELRCEAVMPGCVDFVITIGRRLASDPGKSVIAASQSYRQLVHDVTRLAQMDDLEHLRKRIPDHRCVKSIRRAFGTINSTQRELVLSIRDSHHEVIYDGSRTSCRPSVPVLDEAVQSPITLDEKFFTGRLNSIGVKSRTVILDLVRGGSVELPDVDFAELGIPIERENLVQVVGVAERNGPRSRPKIKKLESIEVVDESPIVLTRFAFGKHEYVSDPPLRFSVHFSEQEDYYEVRGDFGIFFTEDTREEVEIGVMEMLECNWDEIAMATDPTKMTKGAQKLREDMLKRISKSPTDA